MTSPVNILLSGMNAASLRASASANNIANARSTTKLEDGKVQNQVYVPQDVISVNQQNGGTLATVIASDKPPLKVYEPGHVDADVNGVVEMPNVDLAEELVNMEQAAADYKANLKALEAYKSTQQSLLDIFV